jgi:hypothetical protein
LSTLQVRHASRSAVFNREKCSFLLILAQIIPLHARRHHLRHYESSEDVFVP